MSLAEIQKAIDQVKRLAEQIEKLLESSKTIVEASSAKVIQDITSKLEECHCNKEILDALKSHDSKEKPETQIVNSDKSPSTSSLQKYSFPNEYVGNAELGSSGNPNAIVFPRR
ncbi:DNA-binding protein [Soybean Putnam virus]|uniref:Virion-associated protein n=1 Tax=Soybean Putnam virus TaxID=1221449 RepID=J7HCY4_9VIRU|nr:DNA-binding protein [Soybean Putnam virus]AFP95348.1 DNA-binding protein [Soybean Putnam virus]